MKRSSTAGLSRLESSRPQIVLLRYRQRHIGPAKPGRQRERVLDRLIALCLAGHVVQCALRVDLLEVGSRRQEGVGYGEKF